MKIRWLLIASGDEKDTDGRTHTHTTKALLDLEASPQVKNRKEYQQKEYQQSELENRKEYQQESVPTV